MEDPAVLPMGAPSDVLTDLRRTFGHAWREGDPASVGRFFAFEFEFAEAVLVVEAEPQFDQLIIHVEDASGKLLCSQFPDGDCLRVDMSSKSWWPEIGGASTGWRWVLNNQQGYQDGAQLEFHVAGVRRAVIQFVTWASSLRVYLVTEVG